MQPTARTVLYGRVTKIARGAEESRVTVRICGSDLTSRLPNEKVQALGLKIGGRAKATLALADTRLGLGSQAPARGRAHQLVLGAKD